MCSDVISCRLDASGDTTNTCWWSDTFRTSPFNILSLSLSAFSLQRIILAACNRLSREVNGKKLFAINVQVSQEITINSCGLIGVTCPVGNERLLCSPFQLATPPDFHPNHNPELEPCNTSKYVTKYHKKYIWYRRCVHNESPHHANWSLSLFTYPFNILQHLEQRGTFNNRWSWQVNAKTICQYSTRTRYWYVRVYRTINPLGAWEKKNCEKIIRAVYDSSQTLRVRSGRIG